MISSQRLWPLDHEAGLVGECLNIQSEVLNENDADVRWRNTDLRRMMEKCADLRHGSFIFGNANLPNTDLEHQRCSIQQSTANIIIK